MWGLTKALFRGAFVCGLIFALGFGVSQTPAAADWPDCDDYFNGEIGTCPPYNDYFCNKDCVRLQHEFGMCFPTEAQGCCTCAV